MRAPCYARGGRVAFNMTPMIDVVFQLIIFFLVSSHLAKQEAQMELPLPVANTGAEAVEDSRRVTLNVLRDGQLVLAGKHVDGQELDRRLTDARREHGDDVEVRIRADRDVPYREVSRALMACARAGVWQVNYGVYRPEDAR